MRIEFRFIFDRKKTIKKPTDKGLIEFVPYYQGERIFFSTKIKVLPGQWDKEKERLNSKHSDANLLNDELDKMIEKVKEARRLNEAKKLPFTLDNIKDIFRKQEVRTGSFSEYAFNQVKNNNAFKPGTKTQHYNTLKTFKEFNNNKDVLFTDLKVSFIKDYVNYLFGKKLAQNTIRKHRKNIKANIEIAIRSGIYEFANPCKEVPVKEIKTKRVVLTWTQILLLEDLKFEKYEDKLEKIRDMFLFACYTGLRISDITNLKTDYVKNTDKGLTLDFFTVKVNKHAVLPLMELFPIKKTKTSRPIKILNKYFNKENEFIFRKFSHPYINRELKIIAALAKIDMDLTFHIGRETFGTYMANKVSAPILMRLLQHSKLETTQKYIHLNEQMISEGLIKAKWD
ncbi:MAG: site-specific integrase [Bacteroidetes bacterium]|nr:site-specific integrase [Bacteroidota bacterium]